MSDEQQSNGPAAGPTASVSAITEAPKGRARGRARFDVAAATRAAAPRAGSSSMSLVAASQRAASEAAAAQAGIQAVTVGVADVAEHPKNGRRAWGDMEGLARSIAEVGIEQLPMADHASQVLALRPDWAEQIGDAQYVLRAGHRRLRAAKMAGFTEITINVHPTADLVATFATFFHENFYRQGVSPLEIAGIVGEVKNLGLSQREIAKRLDMSAATVNRYLKLLELPPMVQERVHEGGLSYAEATEQLGGLTTERLLEVWTVYTAGDLGLAAAARAVELEHNRQDRISTVRAELEADGIDVVESAEDLPRVRRLLDVDDTDAIAAAKAKHHLVAVPTSVGPAFYDTTPAPKKARAAATSPAGSPSAATQPTSRPTQEEIDQVEATRANAARRAELVEHVRRGPASGGSEAARDMARSVLTNRVDHSRALVLVHAWLKDDIRSGKVNGAPIHDMDQWEAAIWSSGNVRDRLWTAWAIALAKDDIRTASPTTVWDQATKEFYEVLINSRNYEPTPWEKARLAAIR